jgi:hypothetical protein
MENNGRLNQSDRPTYGTIKGNIQIFRNQYGEDDVLTLCCIKVTLLDANNQWVAEEYTDDNGDFAFLGFPLRAYTVIFPESIDYRKQKFVSESSGFRHQFKVELSPEKTVVDDVDIRYSLSQTGLIEGYPLGADAQSMLGINA